MACNSHQATTVANTHQLGGDLRLRTYRSCRSRYEDDVDQGEFFLYTGSGGRDLSGNKRTNKARFMALRLRT